MDEDMQKIEKKLDSIKSELDYIKKNMVERDDILSEEELVAYKRSFKKENLMTLEDAERKLNS